MRVRYLMIGLFFAGTTAVCGQPQAPALINPVGGVNGAAVTLGPDSEIDTVLDALDLAGKNLKDFVADVTMTETDAVTGDETSRPGKVWFQNRGNGDSRIHVTFDKKKLSNRVINEKVEYVLDKGVLLDRNYRLKQEVQRQVVKPGEKLNPLKLGEGPFPLPLGQSKEEVHKLFDVKKVAAAKDDPAGTVHLKFTPRAGTRYARKIKVMDIWVDPETNMPIKIETIDPNETTVRTTNLNNLKLNGGLGDGEFTVEKIGQDWSQRLEQLAD